MQKIAIAIVTLSLIACSSNPESRKQVNGNFNYLKAKQGKELIIPGNYIKPSTSSRYNIPSISPKGLDVGKNLDIRPPLVEAQDTYVTRYPNTLETPENAVINTPVTPTIAPTSMFKVDYTVADVETAILSLTTLSKIEAKFEIYKAVLAYSQEHNITFAKSDIEAGVLITDPIRKEVIAKKRWYWKNEKYATTQIYKFDIKAGNTGADGQLIIKLAASDVNYSGADSQILADANAHNYTQEMANDIKDYIQNNRSSTNLIATSESMPNTLPIEAITQAKSVQPNDKKVYLAFDHDKAYYISDSNFDNTWKSLGNALNEMGFTDISGDYIRGQYETFWRKGAIFGLFGSKAMDLDTGNYVFKLMPINESKTKIEVFDSKGDLVNSDQLTKSSKKFTEYMQNN